MNIFERAAREKVRFGFRGIIATEDLWDLSMGDLDEIFKQANILLKDRNGEGLIKDTSKNTFSGTLQLQVDLVRYVFEEKQKMANEAEAKILRMEKKKRIMEIITDKQDETLAGKSVAELKEMLDDM